MFLGIRPQLRPKKTVTSGTAGLLLIFFFWLVLFPAAALAQAQDSFGLEQAGRATGLGGDDIRLIVARVIRIFLSLLGIIALVINLYAGYLIMTAGGNEEKITTGKRWLVNGVIGLAIILSAFAITQFIISRLAGATGFGGDQAATEGAAPGRATFAGSGALGRIVRDHYPFRDQPDVARNTKITVTFAEPIDARSLIADSNANSILGDCINTDRANFSWERDCDRAILTAVRVFRTPTGTPPPAPTPLELSALAVRESPPAGAAGPNNEVRTFVFRPLALLGEENATGVPYTVILTNEILKADGRTRAFVNDRSGRYEWQFSASNELDISAPRIESVYPSADQTIPRNSIIQINFSEAVDPTVVQGLASGPNSAFYHIIFGDTTMTGEWRVSNAYRTVEFVSDQACGQNSCGDVMYCLPSACPANDQTCRDNRQLVVRTAALVPGARGTFEAIPFSGVADLAGNALDGDGDGAPDGKPALPGNFQTIRLTPNGAAPFEDAADNYFWRFRVQNTIDRTSPFIEQVTPGIDAEEVAGDERTEVRFSRVMWSESLSNLAIEEFGLPPPPAGGEAPAQLWFRPTGRVENDRTIARLDHRVFGPNSQVAYYFTSVGSQVRSLNQNCLYPGRGPVTQTRGASPVCAYRENPDGTVAANQNCAPVTVNAATDTTCAQTANEGTVLQPDRATCIQRLQVLSPTN